MAWEDELEPDWIYELPFYLVATIAYGAVLTVNPIMRWGSGKAAEQSVPIEFVAAVPLEPASQNLALPPSAGEGRVEPPPRKGPGDYVPEKIKKGAQDAHKTLPIAKPAAVNSIRERHGSTIVKHATKTKPVVAKTVKAAPKPVDVKALVAASVVRRAKVEHAKEVKAAAAEVRAEIAREKAEAARVKAVAAKEAKARRVAKARADAQARADAAAARAQALADAKAAKAAKKAELSQELATMSDPDVALAQDADSPAPAGGSRHPKGKSVSKAGAVAALAAGSNSGADDSSADDGGAALAGARKAGAAAALADTAESTDPGDAAGSGGADLLDAKAKGGGTGPDGAGVSYSLDGPVGSRRVLRRAVPSSPDWVGTRGLDLTVTVRFQVLPDGTVKPGAVIRKTSGFPEIDRLALDALRKWRFESVPADGGPEVWGRVTFRFTS